MVNKKLHSFIKIGLEFFEFLTRTNQDNITDRAHLSNVYQEFVKRDPGNKYPKFGSVVYALKCGGYVSTQNGTVHWRLKEPQAVQNGGAPLKEKHKIRLSGDKWRLLKSPLSWGNYFDKFHLLLDLEGWRMDMDIRRYNIPNRKTKHAIMFRDKVNKNLLVLEVPGVSENRPSVLQGDLLYVFPIETRGVMYRGYIHSVELDRVKLSFGSELLDHFVDGMKFRVEFTVNRLTLVLQHRAVNLALRHRLAKVLFPATPPHFSQATELPKLSLYNSQLEGNPQQHQAVQHIVAGSSKPAPYLLFGPPGTGKTVVLVEAIKQIFKTQPSSYILVCTPYNSAADLICMKILDKDDKDKVDKVYRMYAKSCDTEAIPEKLKAYSNLNGGEFVFPAKEKLMKYRVMVTTLFTAGRLVTKGIPQGHFTHVFVDVAEHAVETECLIPLAGLLHAETGHVVLAGDPKQLGPIIRDHLARNNGLGVSLLERLINLYQSNKHAFNDRFVTKLLHNYRSHPDIMEIPKELFYDGELQCHADETSRNSYCKWEHLPQMDFPLIFHAVTGDSEREVSSPSLCNREEVVVLMDYVKKLLQSHDKSRLPSTSPKDIGIIAPYRKQVQEIRKALEKVGRDLSLKDMKTLKVGSVEEFQGLERNVIMVSMVRSNPILSKTDRQFNLGFVKNDKRFNVAVTRTNALLIVVGDPSIKEVDTTWKRFIQFCIDRGGYRSSPFTGLAEGEDSTL